MMVVHACHPRYTGNVNSRIVIQTDLDRNMRPYLKHNQSKKGWGYDSNGKMLAWQTENPKFKT
jgi:hypothetical protein